jgi:hypothetical protein
VFFVSRRRVGNCAKYGGGLATYDYPQKLDHILKWI